MASSKLELVLEAIDRASGPMRKVERAIGGIEDAALDAATPISAVDKALDGIERAARPLGRTEKALEDIERAAEGAHAPISGVERALDEVALHVGQVTFASPDDKAEFETLLRRHSRTVADVVAGETRRESRLSF